MKKAFHTYCSSTSKSYIHSNCSTCSGFTKTIIIIVEDTIVVVVVVVVLVVVVIVMA
jgi:hypothetical protein